MRPINRLTATACGMHLADQIALVLVPLIAATLFGAPAEVIGMLVACQSMAHLLGSLPFGLIIDRYPARRIAIMATLISTAGFAGSLLAALAVNVFLFGLAITTAGFGIVLFGLVILSILPRIAGAARLAAANARVEIPRSVMSFAVPLLIGSTIGLIDSRWFLAAAMLGAVGSAMIIRRLPDTAAPMAHRTGLMKRLQDGGMYVLSHRLLLPISICAVFWNLAFSILIVTMIPLLITVLSRDANSFAIAMSFFGAAAIIGAWSAGRLSHLMPPSILLIFGPASSAFAALGLALLSDTSPVAWLYGCFFILGFGPSMWLVTQNSVRQLVTPADMLGRVNAVIQTAIYGIRPIGALIGGAVTATTSPNTAVILVVAAFMVSTLAALFSDLRKVRRYENLATA